MPIPKLKEIQYRTSAVKKAGQLKKKRAATAPRWKTENVIMVGKFNPSRFTTGAIVGVMFGYTSNLTTNRLNACKLCVIP
jgi:hypothetical protein